MNFQREKLINAFLFFASNTRMCGITKMMKLLNFFEFEHFNQTGVPPIGLNYYAYPQGPLAFDLWNEINHGGLTPDFNQVVMARQVMYPDGNEGYLFIPREGAVPNMEVFTPRETKILNNLAKQFNFASAKDISGFSHADNGPWDRTIREKGEKEKIDYLYALTKDSPINQEYAREKLEEFISTNKLFDINAVNLE